MGGSDGGEAGKELEFERGDLWDGLDDEVGFVEGVEGGGGEEEGPRRISLRLSELLLCDLLGEKSIWESLVKIDTGK